MVKKLRERAEPEASQKIRLAFQLGFVALNLWIGVAFYEWVRSLDDPSIAAARPAGVEGWLPIAGLMNLKFAIATRTIPRIHPAAMFLLVAFIAISVLLKKAFCSWLCPVGTISEFLWKLGRRMTKRDNVTVPGWLDLPLRGVKYALFAFFAWTIVRMPAEWIDEFMRTPHGAIADVRMLNFFRFMSTTTLVVLAILVALSVAIRNFWCRYLCPYGALLGIGALFSPAAITRDADACIDCAKCAKACPARLPVDVLPRVRSAECTLCMSCVAVCPAKGALEVKLARRRTIPAWAVAASIAFVFAAIVITARLTGHWNSGLTDAAVRYLLTLSQP